MACPDFVLCPFPFSREHQVLRGLETGAPPHLDLFRADAQPGAHQRAEGLQPRSLTGIPDQACKILERGIYGRLRAVVRLEVRRITRDDVAAPGIGRIREKARGRFQSLQDLAGEVDISGRSNEAGCIPK